VIVAVLGFVVLVFPFTDALIEPVFAVILVTQSADVDAAILVTHPAV
jgi:hypothetical protein